MLTNLKGYNSANECILVVMIRTDIGMKKLVNV